MASHCGVVLDTQICRNRLAHNKLTIRLDSLGYPCLVPGLAWGL